MIFVTKIKDFKKINKKLLLLINEIEKNPYTTNKDNIFHTDWNLPKNFKRKYMDYFVLIIRPYLNEIAKKLHSEKAVIDNMWFQQYKKNGEHSWHTHGLSNFSNVYFVELPSKSLATEILNVNNLNLEEGNLLTFPSHLYHRSPINKTNKRKTIISFNCDFVNYMDYSKI